MSSRLDLLAKSAQKYFLESQPKVSKIKVIEEKEKIFNAPFVNAEEIFGDILPTIKSDRFYAVSLIGPQGKGKTKLAAILATDAEDNGFLVVYGKAEDIIPNLPEWIGKVKAKIDAFNAESVCIILDDFSYVTETMPRKKANEFKHFISDIKNIFKVKVFMIYNSHRLHAVPPMLRNSGSFVFVAMQAADREDMVKLITRRQAMRDKLDIIYTFISQVSIDGPKYKILNFSWGEHKKEFVWGDANEPGDGRLMVSYHAGDIKIFNSKLTPNMIDIESNLYRFKYTPPPPKTEDEIEEEKEAKKEKLKKKAEELFTTTAMVVKQ